ncbi:endonuclease [Nonlabens ulvanivorans]|uniref:Endonuclease I n=1 Tax=Nonlabens ulvanivorans TaxID=906888 RepID=A0A084JX25_NONUL|nr:endonuclease [Nonlabens ulvanivorans]KEZ93509.1 endonuclease I [Nonlabens ulvanivorans]PRX14102.1 putative secreted protein (Por secretion system target) [Nonlabens ulvanivorans]
MKKLITFITIAIFGIAFAKAQVVINELDSDTPSTNDRQFVELKSDVPFFSLNGYVLVFFNGSTTSSTGMGRSYYTVDLDGLTTDDNGLVVLGSSLVSPVPDRYLAESNIQLGADAVAIYAGNDTDWPDQTFASQTNLISALIYDTDDADNVPLMTLLGINDQYNENENGNKTTESVQRKADGTYETKAPTPHSLNDATVSTYTGIGFTVAPLPITEGSNFDITFTLSQPQTTDFVLNYTIDLGTFDSTDYTGPSQVIFTAGQTSVVASYTIIDDTIDEGDEELSVNLDNNVPVGFKRLKDNERHLVVDNDFQVAAYGTPLAPTYGIVNSTAPANYYDSLDGLASPQLENAITSIIAEEFVVRIHTYDDIVQIMKESDQSPLNSNQVWLMYTEQQRSKADYQTGSNSTGKWNREHIYPRSRGGFYEIEYDETIDGMAVWTDTNVDSLRHGQSDAHHLRATDGGENSSRGNKDYPEYDGPNGTQGSWHGDVARAIFYMTLRYNNIDVVNGNPSNSTVGQLGDLATLLQWHRNDPPDDFEMNRNNVIYTWQINRNPFIDNPELVEYIWGNQVGQNFTLSNESTELTTVKLFPNPSENNFHISGIEQDTQVIIYDQLGRITIKKDIDQNTTFEHDLPIGLYIVKVQTENASQSLKLIVK